jgi:hypothetical protein
MLALALPAASRTSASVLPPASAWLMKVLASVVNRDRVESIEAQRSAGGPKALPKRVARQRRPESLSLLAGNDECFSIAVLRGPLAFGPSDKRPRDHAVARWRGA